VLAKDPSRAIAWDQQYNVDNEWTIYTASLKVVDASEAGSFRFGPDGKRMSYNGDPKAGIEYHCGVLENGNDVALIRDKPFREGHGGIGESGRNFVKNNDGSLSPMDALHLVLGVATVTRRCDNLFPASNRFTGVTLVDKGSPDKVVLRGPGASRRPCHDSSKCRENGGVDDDCRAGIGSCSDGYEATMTSTCDEWGSCDYSCCSPSGVLAARANPPSYMSYRASC
jgi:hypothetical protein